MTVSALIAKLQGLDPNLKVLMDKPSNLIIGNEYLDAMAEPTVVAKGVAYELVEANVSNSWITSTPWEHGHAGQPLQGVPVVYIGTGESIIGPLWQKL
jgi:hypothetical protein